MLISREKLRAEANATGFREEILEKVILLMDLLEAFATQPFLRERIALKGGTALNLFYFNLPRLSIDIDLNYHGAVDREVMRLEREKVESTVLDICQKKGYTLYRLPKVHAGGKIVLRYPSALGQKGNLEIDLNFMYRVPLWPIQIKDSCRVGSYQAKKIPTLDLHELAAGKLTALIDRQTGRDLFDVYHLLTTVPLNKEKLRLAFVIYGAMSSKKDFRAITLNDISLDKKELTNKLVPMLSRNFLDNIASVSVWSQHLLESCRMAFSSLLPFNKQERKFLELLRDQGKIDLAILDADKEFVERVSVHPGLHWVTHNARKKPA